MIRLLLLPLAYFGGYIMSHYTYVEIKGKQEVFKKAISIMLLISIIMFVLYVMNIVPSYLLILSFCALLFFRSNLDYLQKRKNDN